MREEEDEKVGLSLPVVGHGRANLSTGRANILEFLLVLDRQGLARPCQCEHGPCQGSGHGASKFFSFS